MSRVRVLFSPNLELFERLCGMYNKIGDSRTKIAPKPTKSGAGWSDRAETFVYASKCVPKHPGKVWAPSEHYELS